MLQILPSARVGHIGVYRDPETLGAVEYYFKMPREMADRDVIVVDPMLATGNSAIAAVDRVKAASPRSIKFVCVLAAPEGIAELPRDAPRRADLHGRHRRAPRRARLHRARHGRCGRSLVRDEVTLSRSGASLGTPARGARFAPRGAPARRARGGA